MLILIVGCRSERLARFEYSSGPNWMDTGQHPTLKRTYCEPRTNHVQYFPDNRREGWSLRRPLESSP